MCLVHADGGDHPFHGAGRAIGLAGRGQRLGLDERHDGQPPLRAAGPHRVEGRPRRVDASLAPQRLGEQGTERVELVIGAASLRLPVGDPVPEGALRQGRLAGIELRARQGELVGQQVDDVLVGGLVLFVAHVRSARSNRVRERNGPRTARRALAGAR
jgi:hypothetical protein